MADLFAGVQSDSLNRAMWSFFPEQAYDRLKAIADPRADWHDRLVGDFALDIGAAHRYLESFPGAAGARLLSAVVSPAAAWIPPGYCYNSIGYWHAPGARLVYLEDGRKRSIGIASLISWRGQWYVVHFGAVLRTRNVGVVDSPAAGEGPLGPPGGC